MNKYKKLKELIRPKEYKSKFKLYCQKQKFKIEK